MEIEREEQNRKTARIKFFNERKGWGIIENGESYFLHITQLKEKVPPPKEGDMISFIPAKTGRGWQATEAVIVERDIMEETNGSLNGKFL